MSQINNPAPWSGIPTVNKVAASGAATTLTTDDVQDVTLTAEWTPTFPEGRKPFYLILREDGSGGHGVNWPSTTRWSAGVFPELPIEAGAVSAISFTPEGTTNWQGAPVGYGFAVGGSTPTIPTVVQTALNLKYDAANVEESVSTSKVKVPTSYAVQQYVGKAAVLSADVGPVKEQTALQNLTGLSLEIGKSSTEIWLFKMWLLVSGANVTHDAKFGFTVPASCTMKWGGVSGTSTVAAWGATAVGTNPLALKTESEALEIGTLAGTSGILLQGLIYGGGTEGTIQAQYAQATSNAGNLSILKGSCLEYRRLAT